MRIKSIRLFNFKRFNDLTLDLTAQDKKIVALVGPNGSGKSSIFDAFEEYSTLKRVERSRIATARKKEGYYKKSTYQDLEVDSEKYTASEHVFVESDQNVYTDTSFYIRSAHRFTPRIEINEIKKLSKIEDDEKRPKYLIDADTRLEENYARLIGGFFHDVYGQEVTGKQWSEANIESLNTSLQGILDISIVSLGNPTEGEGSLYFKKGTSSKFPYENLSAGEKEVVDLILDIYVKRDIYSNSLICIDEPELHLNTSIQRKLLIEIERIIPDSCQLWIATHSIGFLRALQDELKDKTLVFDFIDQDFDCVVTLKPIAGTRLDWTRIFETALEDLTGLLAPKRIIYCEGRPDPTATGVERGLDADIYNEIFSLDYTDSLFVSSGGGNVVTKNAHLALKVLKKAFNTVDLYLLRDKDDLTDEQRIIFLSEDSSHKMLIRREIENFIFDKEILKKFCVLQMKTFDEARYDKSVIDIVNQDLKPVQQEIQISCQESGDISLFKRSLARFVSKETSVFKELETVIGLK